MLHAAATGKKETAGPEPTAKDEREKRTVRKSRAKKDEAKAGEDEKKDDALSSTVDPQQAERERVKKENERKMNAYRDQKKKAKDREGAQRPLRQLVLRRLGRRLQEAPANAKRHRQEAEGQGGRFGMDAFRKLEDEGLKAKP